MKKIIKPNEELANYSHDAWSRWMIYLFSQCSSTKDGSMIIPCDKASKWLKQAQTDYFDLLELEKDNFRKEAIKIQSIFIGDDSFEEK